MQFGSDKNYLENLREFVGWFFFFFSSSHSQGIFLHIKAILPLKKLAKKSYKVVLETALVFCFISTLDAVFLSPNVFCS